MKTRIEHDLLGNKEVPMDAYYGVQTLRAIENFAGISGYTIGMFPNVKALAMVKWAAAKANFELGLIPADITNAITAACEEIIDGKLADQFPVDMVQGGAGTSTNMNINEVVANRALELLGHQKGEYEFCHPNNHVNLSQSTNDAYPTSFHLAIILTNKEVVAEIKLLVDSFRRKRIRACIENGAYPTSRCGTYDVRAGIRSLCCNFGRKYRTFECCCKVVFGRKHGSNGNWYGY